MTYIKQNWVDDLTEVDKAHMDHIEDGLVALDTGTAAALGQPNGYASLDATGKVPSAQLPTVSGSGVPTGALFDWPAAAAPTGFLLCDGSAVSRTTYAALYAVIGSAYGAGDGSTTFNLPDFQGRVAVGKGNAAAVNALGASDGQALASRTIKHAHTNGVTVSHNLSLPNHGHAVSDPGHSHLVATPAATGGVQPSAGNRANTVDAGAASTQSSATGVSVGNPTSNPAISGSVTIGGTVGVGISGDAPAYLVINKVIKT